MDCDFLAFSAHKMCGPTGIGILYGKKELLEQMQPIYLGGDSNARYDRNGNMILKDIPYRFESGTQPIEAIFGLHAAIQYLTAKNLARLHAVSYTHLAYDFSQPESFMQYMQTKYGKQYQIFEMSLTQEKGEK